MTGLVAWFRGEIGRAPALYAAVGVVLAACLAYANSIDGGFHYDDGHHIVANPFLRSLDYADDYFTRPDMFRFIARWLIALSVSGCFSPSTSVLRATAASRCGSASS